MSVRRIPEKCSTVHALQPQRGSMASADERVSNEKVGKRLLNVEEVARYLGLEVDTVYKKARLRDLPSVKVGRALRFDVKALDRYIEQHAIKPLE